MQLIECVPNFSEGQDKNKINHIIEEISFYKEINLVDVDSGFDTNRTVITFIGEPELVINAAYKAIKKASEIIDMKVHKGTHPRMGATDVCPIIPIKNKGLLVPFFYIPAT